MTGGRDQCPSLAELVATCGPLAWTESTQYRMNATPPRDMTEAFTHLYLLYITLHGRPPTLDEVGNTLAYCRPDWTWHTVKGHVDDYEKWAAAT